MFPLTRPILFQAPDSAIFLSVKMQNKKVKHRPLTKYLHFHKITGRILFFSGEKIEKKFLLPTDQVLQHVSGNTAFFALNSIMLVNIKKTLIGNE